MTQEKRRADDDGKIKIPRTISVGNLATLAGGILFAIGLVAGAQHIYDNIDTKFEKIDGKFGNADDARISMERKIDSVNSGLVDLGKANDVRFDMIDKRFNDLDITLQKIKDRLELRKADAAK